MRQLGAALLVALCASVAFAGDATVPGTLITEPPTLRCLGFHWHIEGDDNGNGAVAVSYRKKGDEEWKPAQPLARIHNDKVYHVDPPRTRTLENLYAGSIFSLEPGTEYEARLTLTDPDGGGAEETVTVRTRPVPTPFADGRTLHVYPAEFAGEKAEPNFTGIAAALSKVEPGDTLLIHAGVYKGGVNIKTSGTPEKPIVLRGAADGEAVLEGPPDDHLVRVGADHIWLENLTIRHPGAATWKYAVVCYNKDKQPAGLVVRRCTFEDFGIGIIAGGMARDYYIADNRFLGRNTTTERLKKNIQSRVAVVLSGQGHVVCHNFVTNCWDGIGITAGNLYPHNLEQAPENRTCSIDFHNNDIRDVLDDFVETDHSSHNLRVWENRCFNSGVSGLSAQPVYGGPVYFIRNVLYNCWYYIEAGANNRPIIMGGNYFKLHCGPVNVRIYHNTLSGSLSHDPFVSYLDLRNNIMMEPLRTGVISDGNTVDYNAYRAREGWPLFWWSGVKDVSQLSVLEGAKDRREAVKALRSVQSKLRQGTVCANLDEVREKLGFEKHGMVVDYSIFLNAAEPEPVKGRMYDPEKVDLRPKEGAPVIDAAEVLPNINDGYLGDAPDIGAYEFGAPMPVYGPRPERDE